MNPRCELNQLFRMGISKFYVLVILLVSQINVIHTCMLVTDFQRLFDFDNKKISKSVMWTRNSLRKEQCLDECSREKYCLSVQFSAVGGVCVALRERFDGVSVITDEGPGYQLYQKSKSLSAPGSECELDVDCLSLTNSYCRNGRCECSIGYGIYGKHCRILTECDNFSDKFSLHETKSIAGYNIANEQGMTRTDCKQMCIDNPACRSAEYCDGSCYLQSTTWCDVPESNRVEINTCYDFYQRECDW